MTKPVPIRNTPLTLITIRDLITKPNPLVIMTEGAYNQTSGSVLDYARRSKVQIAVIRE